MVNFRIFSLSFLSDKVIKAIICCDRHSLAKFFQFFTDVSVDCDYLIHIKDTYKDTRASNCELNIEKYANMAKW